MGGGGGPAVAALPSAKPAGPKRSSSGGPATSSNGWSSRSAVSVGPRWNALTASTRVPRSGSGTAGTAGTRRSVTAVLSSSGSVAAQSR